MLKQVHTKALLMVLAISEDDIYALNATNYDYLFIINPQQIYVNRCFYFYVIGYPFFN